MKLQKYLVKMTERVVVLSIHIETQWFKRVELVNSLLSALSTPGCGSVIFGVSQEIMFNLNEHVL